MYETTVTIVGNLTDDVELRYTPSGAAMARFRVASTPRVMDKTKSEWTDGDPLFMTCTVWRDYAENVAESISRGTRVVVTGRLRQRSYETREGEKRTVTELEVDEVGVALRYVTAKPTKLNRPAVAPRNRQERTSGQDRPRQTAMAGGGYADDEPPF